MVIMMVCFESINSNLNHKYFELLIKAVSTEQVGNCFFMFKFINELHLMHQRMHHVQYNKV